MTLQVGDRVRANDEMYKPHRGMLGIVTKGDYYTPSAGGPYVLVHFDGEPAPREGMGWYPSMFDKLFGVGDRVKIVKSYDDGASLGRFGIVEHYDGSEEGLWPYKVKYEPNFDGDFDFYNAQDLEAAPATAAAPIITDEVDAEEDITAFEEGFLVVNEDNELLGTYNTEDEAIEEAGAAADVTQASTYVYKLVRAFEVIEVVVETTITKVW